MLDQLPPEIILQIISHLPTIQSILNVCQISKKLLSILNNDRSAIFHTFVQLKFPSIQASPPWQDTARALTSRARAWHRRGLIARECAPPRDEGQDNQRDNRWQNFTYVPVIDSYGLSDLAHGKSEKNVLVWGAAGRVRLRTTRSKVVRWSSFKTPDDSVAHTDILDIRLLRPHQNKNVHGESMVIRRANGEISLLNSMPEKDNFAIAATFLTKHDFVVECMAMSNATEPLLAVCSSKSVQISPVHSDEQQVQFDKVHPFAETSTIKQRKRCVQFLTDTSLAVATQHLEGLSQAPIEIFDISSAGLSSSPLTRLYTFETEASSLRGRKSANTLAKVDPMSSKMSSTSDLLLSGWSDGVVRLHDTRCGPDPVRQYTDAVDDGQIFSILPIGQERFLAGSHQNACLKIFDMRMNASVYECSRLHDMSTQARSDLKVPSNSLKAGQGLDDRNINIFLALTVHRASQPWQPLPGMHNSARLPRYRGSIYSLSSPSPTSSTVFAGIQNHVIQLDFVNTDDCFLKRGGAHNVLDQRPILDISCYERPREGYESTDTVLLRKQAEWRQCWQSRSEAEPGWDERWRLERQRTRRGMAARWQSDGPRR